MLRKAALTAAFALLAATPVAGAAPTGTPATIASGLSTPWDVLKLPDGGVLVPEIVGRIRVIENGSLNATAVYEDLAAEKFLGIALSPQYAQDRHVYLYETRRTGDGTGTSRIVRLRDTGNRLVEPHVIFTGIDSDLRHDGGRIAFGPDGFLYVTTGDIHDKSRPRDIDNLNGKILRMTADGRPVPGNPFHTDTATSARDFVWSSGHRHPQGLAWDAQGRLWSTEHGPSGEGPPGAMSGHDELNLIEAGNDYGWPDVAGSQTLLGTEPPKWHSGPAPALAPGGLAFSLDDGLLYAPGLYGQRLQVFDTDAQGDVTNVSALYAGQFGRLRAATTTPGALWFTTHSSPMRVLCVPVADGGASPEPSQVCSTRRLDGRARDLSTPRTTTTPPPPTTAPAAPLTPLVQTPGPIFVAPPSPATRATELARRLRAAMRSLRLRGLLRRGSAGVRAGGFEAGSRVSVRVRLNRPGRPALTVATGEVRPASRAPVTVRVRLGRRGRAALRRATTARLTVRVTYTPPGGAPVTRAAAASVRR